ncbi:MAG: glycosyltransferase family 2 protein [Bacteroidota bacterium]
MSLIRAASTLLIPVHRGREEYLKSLLHSIARAQSSLWYPSAILIATSDIADIDNVVRPVAPELPVSLSTHVFPECRNLASLRNRAAGIVATEWIHSVDSDTLIPPDYFVKLERAMASCPSGVHFVQLNFVPVAKSFWARCEGLIDTLVLSRYITVDSIRGFNGMNFMVRHDALRSAGGFAEDQLAAEDVELGYRFWKLGMRAVFLPDVAVLHRYPDALRALLRRKFWHGRGYAMVFRRCPELFRRTAGRTGVFRTHWKTIIKPAFFLYYGISSLVFLAGLIYETIRKRSVATTPSTHHWLTSSRA